MDIKEITALDGQYYMQTFGRRIPASFVRGDGCTLYDTEDRQYTDFLAGIAVNALGYAHPGFTEALQRQLQTGVLHTSNIYYIGKQAEAAKALCTLAQIDRVFFGNSGSEANEAAIKLARKYFYDQGRARHQIITATGSFHGRTLATLAATGQEKYHKPYTPLTPTFMDVPYNDIPALEQAVTGQTCAVLLECIEGEGGVIPAQAEFLSAARSICDRHGALLILDEVQTGMGRTGKPFACQYYGIRPDIMTAAKALGNGVPVGAVMATGQVAQAFQPGDHGSTFGGNFLACCAALFMSETLLNSQLLQHVQKIGDYFKQALLALKARHDCIQEVRGIGLMLGLGLSDTVQTRDMARAAFDQGFLIGTAGQNTLRLTPPLIVTECEIDALCVCLDNILP